ncbi:MAG: sigma-70 family RNA polymerase sigma factor [Clostridia bacterium]|nr:sigma-70 family RNA polymerase sigma factor [Clostridia bacterium]
MTDKRASELLSENLTAIYGYAFSRLYDKDKVDDLTSEIVYEIMISVRNLQNEEAFWGFAWKIAENTFRRFIRKNELAAKTVALSEEVLGVYELSPEQEYLQKEAESEEIFLLRRELSLLKKRHREVCVAYYVDNKSCSQIAKDQNISVEMVKYHLFKTRKLLKEGIGMTRTLGEKSYNPGTFRLDFWGDRNQYDGLFKRKLPGAILLAAYYEAMTAEALSMELGVSMPYLEEEIETLVAAGVLKKTGEKYQTNLVILTDAYEKEFVKSTSSVYADVARSVFEKAVCLLPQIRNLRFNGNDYDDNRLLFGILNLAFIKGYLLAKEQSPYGKPNKLALGCCGWIFGYDNDYANHHFLGVMMEARNNSETAWFSVENYRAIMRAQMCEYNDFPSKAEVLGDAIMGKEANRDNPALPQLIENNFILCQDGRLSANFLVFDQDVYEAICTLLAEIIEEVANCMIDISNQAEAILAEHAPASVKEQCGDIAKIHHRLDVAAFLLEELINQKQLTVPNEKIPLCMWGVKTQ